MSFTTYTFNLPHVNCINCVGGLEAALIASQADWKDSQGNKYTARIHNVSLDLAAAVKTVAISIEGDVPEQYLIGMLSGVIDDMGLTNSLHSVIRQEPSLPQSFDSGEFFDLSAYEAVWQNDNTLPLPETDEEEPVPQSESSGRWAKLRRFLLSHAFQGAVGLTLGLALMAVCIAFPAMPFAVMISLGVASIILTLILGARSYYEAAQKLIKSRTLTMDTLFAISTLTVIGVSIAAFFVPWLPMMLDAGLLIFGFRHVGQAIEESVKRSMSLDKKFQDDLPKRVRVCLPENKCWRALTEIVPGDILRIEAGELIPVNGECLNDGADLYDTIKTGASQARAASRGEPLLSGMRLHETSRPMYIRATATMTSSHLAVLDQNIALANSEKAPIQEVTGRILQYFIPAVIALAIISGIVIGVLFPPALAIQCAVAVLVSACPCTLGLVVPLAVKIGMQKGAQHGVQFKSGKTLQAADAIDVVVFDLNGTLTEGMPAVDSFVCVADDAEPRALLAFAAAMERSSDHPMARAISQYAQSLSIDTLPVDWDAEIDSTHHSGLSIISGDEQWSIGNATMMREQGVSELPSPPALQGGETLIYLSKNRVVQGYFVLSDPLRREACHTIHTLMKLGKEVHICTGADEATARRYAGLLGIPPERVAAACVGLAESGQERDKRAYIQSLRQRGLRVAMVGDAGNDSLALAESDFGIAVKSSSGSLITQQEAGAVVQSGSLLPIASAFEVAQQTVRNIKYSLIFSLGYNTVGILLAGGLMVAAIGFAFNPGFGALLMVVQVAVVLGIACYLKNKPLKHLSEPSVTEEYTPGEPRSSYHYLSQTMTPGNQSGFHVDLDSDQDEQFAPLLSTGTKECQSVQAGEYGLNNPITQP
ncbi:heavy metal translocating P-type ATPase [Legionella sp. CNM-4043-24]|uniref:heavy metal translocating P-type ATPase n=1 Tax=Legionella sp. CNM-4043-24 TaxID=3421646 RepID=UPI00403A7E12